MPSEVGSGGGGGALGADLQGIDQVVVDTGLAVAEGVGGGWGFMRAHGAGLSVKPRMPLQACC